MFKDPFHFTKYILIISFLVTVLACKQHKNTGEEHKYTNALIEETSPYLLQHAHNPVDWRPWSEEALEEAKKQDKLVLVSIGYSSCHWCHVMEKETFEDESIAALMNENFINIKVDREERPDVDQVYMTALQLIKGNGGWPLNVITLPDGKPLYGGTYHTNTQWRKVITEISSMYREDPERARQYSERVAAGIQEVNLIQKSEGSENINKTNLQTSLANWQTQWDLQWGGNKGVQKFMLPSNLDFLLQYAHLAKDEAADKHLKNTLDRISLGGIYDHVGGGFYRYSTDTEWKVPHFEKMLYDNAQLMGIYSQAYKAYREDVYRDLVYQTFDFLLREMKSPAGGFYAALDADSEGEEGKFYVWKKEELQEILGSDFELFAQYYSVNDSNAWETDKYVLHKSESDFAFASSRSLNIKELKETDKGWKEVLLRARDERVRPGLDDKIITSWNALLVDGLVEAYKSFGDEKFLTEARETFEVLKKNSFDGKYLVHSFKENSRRIDGFLDDYAFMISASLQLYEVTGNTDYLDFASELNETVVAEFKDESSDLYRYNRKEELISKIVKINDGVMPSPNATMVINQLKLGHILYDPEVLESVDRALETLIPAVIEDAANYSEWGSLLVNRVYPYFEIAVVGSEALKMAGDLHSRYLPNALVVASEEESELPLFKDRFFEDDTYIFVCQNNTCKLPVNKVSDALGQLDQF